MPKISKKNKQDTKTLKTDILSSEKKINEKEQIKSNQSLVKSKKDNDIEVEVFDVKGQVTEKIKLPKEIFGVKVNEQLISQAIRVYLANQRRGTHSTKTRGEVKGSTRKIWRQKGTGRARHGGIRAPIFVKGGVVFGPKPRDYSLKLPQKMRQLALYSALSSKVREGKLKVLAGVTSLDGKTKLMFNALKPFIKDKKTSILFVMPSSMREVARSIRNIEGVSYLPVNQLNTYNVIANKLVIFMKEALDVIKKEKEK